MDLKRRTDENEEQYIWRLGQAKDSGQIDLDWNEIADLVNKEFRNDETEYRSESAYRKRYQTAKLFYENGVFNRLDEDTYLNQLRSAKQDVRKEKQKLFDERVALNKMLRETARNETDLLNLESLIRENGTYTLPPFQIDNIDNGKNMIVCLSDFHIGTDVKNHFGAYNAEIAEERLVNYLKNILKIKETHQVSNVYLFMLGDILSGEIHLTTQLQNRENVTEQIQKSAEMLSAFVYELSKHFSNVYINSVPGNHSRTSFKDQVLRNNRLDNLVPWYMEAKLSHLDHVHFISDKNYDSTIGCVQINDLKYLLVHGDFDSFNESGISKLLMMLDLKTSDVDAIFYGHLHRCSFDDVSNVKIIRSGSFCGSVDDYTISRRLIGNPSQIVCVVGESGIESFYQISLS